MLDAGGDGRIGRVEGCALAELVSNLAVGGSQDRSIACQETLEETVEDGPDQWSRTLEGDAGCAHQVPVSCQRHGRDL
jgi:hypothetical protein